MIRRPPRSTLDRSSAASDVYKRQRKDRLNTIAEEIINEFGVKVQTLELDVRNFEEVKNKFDQLNSEWKQVDLLVNNAGLAKGLDKFYEGKLSDWNEMIDTNICLLYTSPSPRDRTRSRMPSSA